VLWVPSGVHPPPLPWADELSPDNAKVARWARLDSESHGDGKIMPRNLYTLVVDGRDPDDVIHAFHNELLLEQACDEAVLMVSRANDDGVELYVRNGAPQLLAAVRGTALPMSLIGSIPIDEEAALRELVDRKLKLP